MELNNLGSVAWKYNYKENGKYEFGLKKCILIVDNDEINEIYLIGEKEAGYGKEILIRNNEKKELSEN